MDRSHTRRFPTPISHDGRDYLTTEQVAKVLGIKTSSIYSYVSRGRLRSVRIAGHDGSVFPVDEVETLLAGPRRRPPAGVAERIRTQLTLLADDHLYYRGHDATALARTRTVEQVAELLWEQPWQPVTVPASVVRTARRAGGPQARGLDRIRFAVDLVGARDPLRHTLEPREVTTRAATAVTAAVDAVGEPGASNAEATLAQRLWVALSPEPPTPRRIRLLQAALVLQADHDMSAGTIAARVAASARGSVYAVLGAGLGAFDGPIHGGATTLAYRFLAAGIDDPIGAVAAARHAGTPIPGTGHVVYRSADPRAQTLLALVRRSGGGDRRVGPALTAIEEALGETFVNSDLALAAIALRYRMRPDAAETIFAVARMIGWVAHALEEYQAPRLRFRPEGVYTGVRPRA
ncbi:MAG: citrate synthase [Gordonia sp. (in: high G+C Gram-positive bacteria)]